MNAKLLIFDLDGTLIDSAPDIILVVNTLMGQRGRTPLPDEKIIAAIGGGLKQTVFALFPETHGHPVELEKLESDFFELYERYLLVKTTVFPGTVEFIESYLAASDENQIAVVTNKYERLAVKVMAGLHLDRFPWLRIYGADSLPERKPSPLPLIEVMKAARVGADETVMIGDGTPDMAAARAAGVRSVGLTFGYSERSVLQAQGATVLIDSFGDLAGALKAL